MTTEIVYSPIKDEDIKNHLDSSDIWNSAFTEDEYNEWKNSHNHWFKYTIKFDGLRPIQCTNIQPL
jgi:hypothetical protein